MYQLLFQVLGDSGGQNKVPALMKLTVLQRR